MSALNNYVNSVHMLSIVIYAQLLRIEEELGSDAVYAGANFRKPVEPY